MDSLLPPTHGFNPAPEPRPHFWGIRALWARLLLVGARHGIHCSLLVSASTGLRSHDDFERDPETDDRPWVAARMRDLQGRPWLQIDVARLLAHPDFLDAGLA